MVLLSDHSHFSQNSNNLCSNNLCSNNLCRCSSKTNKNSFRSFGKLNKPKEKKKNFESNVLETKENYFCYFGKLNHK